MYMYGEGCGFFSSAYTVKPRSQYSYCVVSHCVTSYNSSSYNVAPNFCQSKYCQICHEEKGF